MIVFFILEIIVFSFFLATAVYNILFSVAAFFYVPYANRNKIARSESADGQKFAILIPAYKEDAVILKTVTKNLESFPDSEIVYDIIVIADSLKRETIEALKNMQVLVHEVKFEKSTKVKSLKSALNEYQNYTHVIILDADNVMDGSFLPLVSKAINNYNLGAIQGRRSAKNGGTSVSILDGLSEEISNRVYRQGLAVFNIGVPLAGSGMVFEYELIKRLINETDAVGGFDKALQVKLFESGVKTRYMKDAIVFDEKTDTVEVFENQRKRWLYSHFHFLKMYFRQGIKGLLNNNFDLFNMAVLLHGQLPRLYNLALMFIVTAIYFLFGRYLVLSAWLWLAVTSVYVFSLFLAIPRKYFNKSIIIAIVKLPRLFLTMFLLLFKLKGSNKSFIHTPHKHA